MKKVIQFYYLTLILLLPLVAEPVVAGPGGMIAKAVWNTFWGKLVIILLVLIFLPLLILSTLEENRAVRRARQDLAYMADRNPVFDWIRLRERMQASFYHTHIAWSHEKTSEADGFMTQWFQQNQQQVHLNRWKEQGLINHCDIKQVGSIKPILFIHRNEQGPHLQSMLVVSITATMKDYLAERTTGKVVEGDKRYKEVETIWTFLLQEDDWKVHNIEEASCLFDYTKLTKELTPIEQTLVKQFKA
ncbi:MAG: hypothetical protein OQK12_07205 [Motiliproteus sp.]|nr:hypothetical protein [Motiliproteus sp.]MCW9052399.1 hypothetical protein [Motiliproteus sp.]